MAVIKISDNKLFMPPILKITIGSNSKLLKTVSFTKTFNNFSSSCK